MYVWLNLTYLVFSGNTGTHCRRSPVQRTSGNYRVLSTIRSFLFVESKSLSSRAIAAHGGAKLLLVVVVVVSSGSSGGNSDSSNSCSSRDSNK